MKHRLVITLPLLATMLGGCGVAGQPLARPKAATRLAARASEPVVNTEYRLQLSERGFTRLRAALPWEVQPKRLDSYYDAYTGQAFKFHAQPEPLQFRIKRKGDEAKWQISKPLERRTVAANGFDILTAPPFRVSNQGFEIGLTVARSWEGKLDAGADPLLARTDEFFLFLDDGGDALRAKAQAVDAAWKGINWPGTDILAPAVGAEPLPFYPSATKHHHAMKTAVPIAGGGRLTLHLAMDEVRDGNGRWVDLFEIEAEPDPAPAQDALDAGALEFGKLLAAAGLTPDMVGAPKPDGMAYTLRQLALAATGSPLQAHGPLLADRR